MRAVQTIEGTAVPLDRSDVDTDQIIPSDWLKQVERTGFEKGLFSEWRDDPAFVLNQEQFQGANVLVAGPNFGTGSSREHAVWAIQQYGFEAVISPRFGPIFKNNCAKNGLVPVEVTAEDGEAILAAVEADPTIVFEIDLASRTLRAGDIETTFPMDEATQRRFIEGLDDIGLTLAHEDAIDSFEAKRPSYLPKSA